MASIDLNAASTWMTFNFRDAENEIVASFKMNPADVKLAKRCQEVAEYFEKLGDSTPNTETLEDAIRFNDQLEEKICYLLGYDAKSTLFGMMSATSIMSDGDMFVTHVLSTVIKHVGPEIRKRKQAMAKAVSKHTAKYK